MPEFSGLVVVSHLLFLVTCWLRTLLKPRMFSHVYSSDRPEESRYVARQCVSWFPLVLGSFALWVGFLMTAITWDFGFILWMAPYALIGGWFAFDDWWLALWEIGVAGILSAVAVKWHFDGILLRRLHAGFTTLLPLFWRIQARLNR